MKSTLYWAGLALGIKGEDEQHSQLLRDRISRQLSFLTDPLIIEGSNGTLMEIRRHMVDDDGSMIAEFSDHFGNRVGLGLEANDEEDALEQFEKAYELLSENLKIIDSPEDVHIWSWDCNTFGRPKPVMII